MSNLASLSTAQLVTVYNQLSDRPVKKFTDRTTAEKRVAMLLEQRGLVARLVGDELIVAAPEAVPPTPRQSSGRQPRTEFADNLRIEVRIGTNPKRAGSRAHARFALYRDGMTVAEYKAACIELEGAKARAGFRYLADLHWDQTHQYITVWDEQLISDFDSDTGGPGTNRALDQYRPAK